jgi:transcriptional regulator with XRE-family HTH domain
MQAKHQHDARDGAADGCRNLAFADPLDGGATKDREDLDLAIRVGRSLRKLRTRRGHSLERLAKLSGVSRAMLSQIERGDSAPTITLLWKVARALEVPFAALTRASEVQGTAVLRAARSKVLLSQDGTFVSRALFPFEGQRKVRFYELRLAPGGVEKADADSPGTLANLVVSLGTVEIGIEGKRHLLDTGDAILFEADVVYSYRNPGKVETLMYLVVVYHPID